MDVPRKPKKRGAVDMIPHLAAAAGLADPSDV